MTPEERRRRNSRALKLVVAVFVVGGVVQSVTGPKKSAVMPPDPQTAREDAAREHCMSFLWSLSGGSSLSTYSLAGEVRAKTEPDNIAWCQRNLDQFMEAPASKPPRTVENMCDGWKKADDNRKTALAGSQEVVDRLRASGRQVCETLQGGLRREGLSGDIDAAIEQHVRISIQACERRGSLSSARCAQLACEYFPSASVCPGGKPPEHDDRQRGG